MENSGEIFISVNYHCDDYNNLKLTLSSSKEDWIQAISILDDRINGRYIDPIKQLSTDYNKNGFAIMAIGCLLVEALCQFEKGLDDSKCKSKEHFTGQLRKMIEASGESNTRNDYNQFFSCIRCGILHQAQTKNMSRLTTDNSKVISSKNEYLTVSVPRFVDVISKYFEKYKTDLADPNNTEVRSNFITKMNYICNRMSKK